MEEIELISKLESTVGHVAERIRKRKNGPSAASIRELASLVSALARLKKEIRQGGEASDKNNSSRKGVEDEFGDPGFYEEMASDSENEN